MKYQIKRGEIFATCRKWLSKINPQISLKRLLSLWFILFALIPLFVIVAYATFLFNQRINDELTKRLLAFEKGIDLELIDVEEKLRLGGFRHANDYYLMDLLKKKRETTLQNVTESIIENYIIDRISYFNNDGKHFISVKPKRIIDDPEIILPQEHEQLPKNLLSQLLEQRQIVIKTAHAEIGFALDCYTAMKIGKNGIGFIKETIVIDRHYSISTKERTGLDICLLNLEYRLLVSTLPPQKERTFLYPADKYKKIVTNLNLASETYVMLTKPMMDDEEKPFGYFAILVSRSNAQKTLTGILTIFLLICAGITIIVVLFTRIASKTVLAPIEQLMKATRDIEKGELGQTIEIPKMLETGSLVNSFNKMSGSLSKMKSELERKVDELHQTNVDLKNTQAQLVHSSKMVSLGQLVAGVAHELNNPIGYTYSNLGHLKEYMEKMQKIIAAYDTSVSKLPKKEQEKIKKFKKEFDIDFMLKDIKNIIKSSLDGAHRTKEIVIGLRNFSRLDEAEIKTVDLHEGLGQTLALLQSEFKNKIQVHKNFGKIPKILCYPSQINQVFMNVLTNAAQAIEKKGDIWITTQEVAGHIHISIKDNGKGISAADQGRIFDPFFTTKKVGQGTGLGLSISYGIIQKHNGDILVDSAVGKGATFTIILPKVKRT